MSEVGFVAPSGATGGSYGSIPHTSTRRIRTTKGITETARSLKRDVTTVGTYRARIFDNTHAKTDADLVRHAIHHSLTQ
ncbi:MAG: hypothetical protein OJF47_001736 [Nitrospira sp.]|nr:MAG: hypothetical protein OJF47_001736 [Nitrospira sp.]